MWWRLPCGGACGVSAKEVMQVTTTLKKILSKSELLPPSPPLLPRRVDDVLYPGVIET